MKAWEVGYVPKSAPAALRLQAANGGSVKSPNGPLIIRVSDKLGIIKRAGRHKILRYSSHPSSTRPIPIRSLQQCSSSFVLPHVTTGYSRPGKGSSLEFESGISKTHFTISVPHSATGAISPAHPAGVFKMV